MIHSTRRRWTAIVIALVLAALTIALVVDSLRTDKPRVYPPRKQAQTLLEIAEQSGRQRAINPVIAIAARTAGGAEAALELPDDYADLLAITPDNFAGKPTQTLNASLMAPFIGGRVSTVGYDPVLTAEQSRAVETDPDAMALPRDVWAVPGDGDAAVVRMYTDPTRTRVYVAPAEVVEGVGE